MLGAVNPEIQVGGLGDFKQGDPVGCRMYKSRRNEIYIAFHRCYMVQHLLQTALLTSFIKFRCLQDS